MVSFSKFANKITKIYKYRLKKFQKINEYLTKKKEKSYAFMFFFSQGTISNVRGKELLLLFFCVVSHLFPFFI